MSDTDRIRGEVEGLLDGAQVERWAHGQIMERVDHFVGEVARKDEALREIADGHDGDEFRDPSDLCDEHRAIARAALTEGTAKDATCTCPAGSYDAPNAVHTDYCALTEGTAEDTTASSEEETWCARCDKPVVLVCPNCGAGPEHIAILPAEDTTALTRGSYEG